MKIKVSNRSLTKEERDTYFKEKREARRRIGVIIRFRETLEKKEDGDTEENDAERL